MEKVYRIELKLIMLFIGIIALCACSNPSVSSQQNPQNDSIQGNTDSLSDTSNMENSTCDCNTMVYLNDPDTSGTNIRETPKGKVVGKLSYDPDCSCRMVEISSSEKDWLKLKEGGWVYAPLFAVASRNYREKEILYLNAEPNTESETVAEYTSEQEFSILGCNGDWLFVKGKDGKKGWLNPEMQCPNPLTTCP